MILRVALILVVVIVAVRLLGRWRRLAPKPGARAVEAAHKCPACGAWVLAGERCPCGE